MVNEILALKLQIEKSFAGLGEFDRKYAKKLEDGPGKVAKAIDEPLALARFVLPKVEPLLKEFELMDEALEMAYGEKVIWRRLQLA